MKDDAKKLRDLVICAEQEKSMSFHSSNDVARRNIDYYNTNVGNYIERTFSADVREHRERFSKYHRVGAKILDAGCGSGRDAQAFIGNGFDVLGFDASEEMVKYVNEKLKIPAIQGVFQMMEFSEEFDGIWALASLVHVPLDAMPDVLKNFARALKSEGVLFLSFKEGTGTTEEGERTFTCMNADTLFPYLSDFVILEQWISVPEKGVNLSDCRWLNTIVRKKIQTEIFTSSIILNENSTEPKSGYLQKLVRDRIPEMMQGSPSSAEFHKASTKEYLFYLRKKLQEEIDEFLANPCLEKMADIVEVLEAFSIQMGTSLKEMEVVRLKKAEERGKYNQKLIMEKKL